MHAGRIEEVPEPLIEKKSIIHIRSYIPGICIHAIGSFKIFTPVHEEQVPQPKKY